MKNEVESNYSNGSRNFVSHCHLKARSSWVVQSVLLTSAALFDGGYFMIPGIRPNVSYNQKKPSLLLKSA